MISQAVHLVSDATLSKGRREGIQDALSHSRTLVFAPDKAITATETQRYARLANDVQGLSYIKDGQNVPLDISPQSIIKTHNTLKKLEDDGTFGGLRILCDGMGGQDQGHTAANLAIAVLEKEILSSLQSGDISKEALQKALESANSAIFAFSQAKHANTGTTVLAAYSDYNGKTHLASAGDSRMYLRKTDGTLEQVFMEDIPGTVLAKVLAGTIKPSDVFTDPTRNLSAGLPQSLHEQMTGIKQPMKHFKTETIQLKPGEQIIMTSDGVWEAIQAFADQNLKDDKKDPALEAQLQSYLNLADQSYLDLLAQGVNQVDALKKVNGLLFQKIILYGVSNTATGQEVVEFLNRNSVGEATQDNTSAILIEAMVDQERARPEREFFTQGSELIRTDEQGGSFTSTVAGYDGKSGSMILHTRLPNGQDIWEIVPQEEVKGLKLLHKPEEFPNIESATIWDELIKAVSEFPGFYFTRKLSDGKEQKVFIYRADFLGTIASLRNIDPTKFDPTLTRQRLDIFPPSVQSKLKLLLAQDLANNHPDLIAKLL